MPFALLSSATASSAKCNCSRPSWATGPVNGPSIAIDVEHFFDEVALAAFVVLALLELLELLLPQAATSSAISTAADRIIRNLIACDSSSGVVNCRPGRRAFRRGNTPRPETQPA